MEKCKFCQAELEEGMTVCPACGKNLEETEEIAAETTREETAPEAEKIAAEETGESVSEEITEDAVAEVPAEEAAAEETPVEEKKATPGKIALAVAAIVVLLAILIALLVGGMGGSEETPAETGAAGETVAVETTETVPATIPADGEKGTITEKGTYTVTDEEAKAAAEEVVATIEGKELTNAQLQVYYWMEVQGFLSQYASYASYFGLDYTKPLDTQVSMESEDMTWQHFFLDSALKNWQQIQGMATEAEKAGLTISAEDQQVLDNIPTVMEQNAAAYEMSLEEFMLRNIGAGADIDDFVGYQTDYYRGMPYYEAELAKLVPTEKEIEDYFAENEEGYAQSGLTKDTMLVDVRHILLMPESAAGDGTYTDEEWAACEAEAQKLLDQWKKDPTEDNFAALANENSTDPGSNTNGGLYEDVYEGQMVQTFNDWCFDETRKYGDSGLVKTDYGYHVMFFVGSEPQWKQVAQSDWINTKINAMFDGILENYPLEVSYDKIVLAEVAMG